MFKEKKIKDLKQSDRVFEFGKTLVKVRLVSKEIVSKNKLFGPTAISFQLSACVCDQKGKAIPDSAGRFAILPHTLTLQLMELGETKEGIKKGLEKEIQPLIEKTVIWYQTRKAAENVLNGWKKPKT